MTENTCSREKWDQRFLALADHLAQWSKDPSTRVGCVVVGPDRDIRSTGYNGLPRGVEDTPERLNDREVKYSIIVHAETNAMLHASRIGVGLHNCTAYVTWPPCSRCAAALIQAGIKRIVYPAITVPERWEADFQRASEILREARIDVTVWGGDMGF